MPTQSDIPAFKYPNPNYPQEGIPMPEPQPDSDALSLYERLRLQGMRDRIAGLSLNLPPIDLTNRELERREVVE